MPKGAITEYIDVAQIVLYAFWIFFAGLIYYLAARTSARAIPSFMTDLRTGLISTSRRFQSPRPISWPTARRSWRRALVTSPLK